MIASAHYSPVESASLLVPCEHCDGLGRVATCCGSRSVAIEPPHRWEPCTHCNGQRVVPEPAEDFLNRMQAASNFDWQRIAISTLRAADKLSPDIVDYELRNSIAQLCIGDVW